MCCLYKNLNFNNFFFNSQINLNSIVCNKYEESIRGSVESAEASSHEGKQDFSKFMSFSKIPPIHRSERGNKRKRCGIEHIEFREIRAISIRSRIWKFCQ